MGENPVSSKLKKLALRTLFFIISILTVKGIRFYIMLHKDDVKYGMTELQAAGITPEYIVQNLMLMQILISVMVVLVIVFVQRWKSLDGKVFYVFYFMILDGITLYLYPGVALSIFGLTG